jgi:hypothetical protein
MFYDMLHRSLCVPITIDVYAKDEGSSLNAMIIILKVIVNYESPNLEESFQGTCFWHVFSKACKYGTTEKRVCKI